jgi:hypothetical protein
MKTSTGKQRVRIGTSIILALAMGAFGIISSNAPAQAAEAEIQESVQDSSQKSSAYCFFKVLRYRTYVDVIPVAGTCYQVQAAVKCNNNTWYYAPPGRTSRAYCPTGKIAILGAGRAKVYPTSPWSRWIYV